MEIIKSNTIETQTAQAIELISACQNPAIPIAHPELLVTSVREAVQNTEPLNFVTISCPNWVILEGGQRTVLPITEDTQRAQICFGQDLPRLIWQLQQIGISSRTLIIMSDVFSPDWVQVNDEMKQNTAQNVKAIKQTLWHAASRWGISAKNNHEASAQLKVLAQMPLIGKIPEARSLFQINETLVLQPTSPVGQFFIKTWIHFDQWKIYAERREDNTGLRKIRDRAEFLIKLYATDGQLMPLLIRQAFNLVSEPAVIGVNLEMDIPFAEALIGGWNIHTSMPVITPTQNGTDWSAPPVFI
ncbi:MAG: hypothetical protein ABIE03_04080 [Patescibacteria group bacterium]|nr:hypothetical protein [Patescibacteria group bacterium]